MINFILISILFLFSHLSYSQTIVTCRCDTTDSLVKKYIVVDEAPVFLGGANELLNYVHNQKKILEDYISGQIFISFIINCNGEVCDFSILRTSGNIKLSDSNIVIDYLKLMPKWQPAKYHDKNVDSYLALPVNITNGILKN